MVGVFVSSRVVHADVVGVDTSPILGWGLFFSPNLVMNYRGGLGFFFFFFFLSVKMYSCQHSVGPSLITPRLVVMWSTPFCPLLSKTMYHGILLGFWECEQKHPNMLAWMRQWDPIGPQFKNLFIVCRPFMSRARQSIFSASWASLWISVATGTDNV